MTQKPPRAYATTQVDLPELLPTIKTWVEANLTPEMIDPKLGVEDKPHVTILFGLHSDNVAPVREVGEKFDKDITLVIGELDIFENPEHDVLFASVGSRDLQKLNKLLSGLPHKSDYDDYHPHLTIAFLKKGEGAKFKGQAPFRGVFTFSGFYMSKKDRTKEFIATTKPKSSLLGEVPLRKPLADSVDKSNKKEYN